MSGFGCSGFGRGFPDCVYRDGTTPLTGDWVVGGKAIKGFWNHTAGPVSLAGGAGMSNLIAQSLTDILTGYSQLYVIGVRVIGWNTATVANSGYGETTVAVLASTTGLGVTTLTILNSPIKTTNNLYSGHDFAVSITGGNQVLVQGNPGTNNSKFTVYMWYQTPQTFEVVP